MHRPVVADAETVIRIRWNFLYDAVCVKLSSERTYERPERTIWVGPSRKSFTSGFRNLPRVPNPFFIFISFPFFFCFVFLFFFCLLFFFFFFLKNVLLLKNVLFFKNVHIFKKCSIFTNLFVFSNFVPEFQKIVCVFNFFCRL